MPDLTKPSSPPPFRHVLAERSIRILLGLLALIPVPVSRVLGRLVGRLNLLFSTRSTKTTRQNIAACFPEKTESVQSQLVSASMLHTGQTLMETPAVWLGDLTRLSLLIKDVENESLFREAVEAGDGCVVILPHLGNWEVFNVYLASRGIRSTVLYKPPKQVWFRGVMAEIRERYGNELVPTDVRGISRLFKTLKQNGVVTVLPDQVPASGEFVPFFGEAALTDRLVARLIQKCGARAICVTVPRIDDGFMVRFTEVDRRLYDEDIVSSLTGLNASVEACVRKDPEQYQWEYRRFKVRPEGAAPIYRRLKKKSR